MRAKERGDNSIGWIEVHETLMYLERSYDAIFTITTETSVPASDNELLCSIRASLDVHSRPVKLVSPLLVRADNNALLEMPRAIYLALLAMQASIEELIGAGPVSENFKYN